MANCHRLICTCYTCLSFKTYTIKYQTIMSNGGNTPYEGIHEDSPFVGNVKSSGDLVEELVRAQSTWKYFLLVLSISLVWIPSLSAVFVTSFAGAKIILSKL